MRAYMHIHLPVVYFVLERACSRLAEQRSLTGTWSAAELAARDSRPFAAAAAPYSVTLNPTDIFTFYAEMTLDV